MNMTPVFMSEEYSEKLRAFLTNFCTSSDEVTNEVFIREAIKYLIPKYFSVVELKKEAMILSSLIVPVELLEHYLKKQ